ncbi:MULTISPECIES: hypothetical protein [Exiguobacterium]|uniref:hypothetical protein n=1 Tax=Exiguobacterium TaxID=33986 RepID=UPI001AE16FEC|nr:MULTISPECIES: hypothetical protein [Exiguobacterium]MCT4779596.1 hypothetical protein [Exiguobacterium soli]
MKQQLETVLKDIPVPDNVHARMEQGLRQKKRMHRLPQLILAASLLIGLLHYDRIESWIQPPIDQSTASMIPGLVYQKAIYLQSDTTIAEETEFQLRGQKLGVSQNTWTAGAEAVNVKQSFGSNLENYTIYIVKGYDPAIRLLAVGQEDGAEIVRVLDRSTFRPDYFQQLYLQQKILRANYQTFSTWESTSSEPISAGSRLRQLFAELNKAVPLRESDLTADVVEYQNDTDLRILNVTMADGVTNQFRLIREGYVYYEPLDLYFAVNGPVFDDVWGQLNQ